MLCLYPYLLTPRYFQFSQQPINIADEDKFEAIPVTTDNRPSMIDKDVQTESLHQLWSTVSELLLVEVF